MNAKEARNISTANTDLQSVLNIAYSKIEQEAKKFNSYVVLTDAPFYIWASNTQLIAPETVANNFINTIVSDGFSYEILSSQKAIKISW